MATAYFISNIIGTGTDDDMYRPIVADYPVNWAGVASFDHQTNTSKNWMLVLVAAPDAMLKTLGGVSGVTRVPFGPSQLDDPWTSIGTTSTRNQIASFVRSRTGVQVSRDDPRTVREVVTAVGLSIDPNFNPDALFVAE